MQIKPLIIMVSSLLLMQLLSNSCDGQNTEKKHWYWSVESSISGDFAYGGTDSFVYIDLLNKDTMIRLNAGGTITKLKWDKVGNRLAVASQLSDSLCFIYDVETGRKINLTNSNSARAIGWNSTNSLIAVGNNEGNLRIYSTSGELSKTIELNQKAITDLSWHPSQDKIVTVGHHIAIYDLKNDSIQHVTPRKEEVLMLCVAWHPSGDYFVTGDYGDYVYHYPALLQFWDDKGYLIKEIEESKAEYRNLCWSLDGSTLATASDGIRFWGEHGELLKHINTTHHIWGVFVRFNQEELDGLYFKYSDGMGNIGKGTICFY